MTNSRDERKDRKAIQEEKRRRRAEYLARPGKHYEDHPKPVTRRDFLAHGLLDSMAFVAIPPILRALLSVPELRAEANSFLYPPEHVVFFINSTGGSGSTGVGSAAARGPNGEMMPSSVLFSQGVYPTLTADSTQIVKRHGLWFYNASPLDLSQPNAFYGTLAQALPEEALARMRAIGVQTNARDDSDQGEQGLAGVLARTFLAERFDEPYLLGGGIATVGGANLSARQYATGMSFAASNQLNYEAPQLFQVVRNQTSLLNALQAPFGGGFNTAANGRVLDALALHATALATSRNNELGRQRASEYAANAALVARRVRQINGNFSFLDPATVLDATTRTILQGTNDAGILSPTLAALFSGASLGLATYRKTGGDYHNGNFNAWTTFARETASLVAALINEAHVRTVAGRPTQVTIICMTDGGMFRPENQNGPTGDRGEYCLLKLLNYSASPREVVRTNLGFASLATGNNSQTSLVGDERSAALALVANMMDLVMGKGYRQVFARLVPTNVFSPDKLKDIECFRES